MEFERALIVALKIFVVIFILYVLAIVFIVPIIMSGNLLATILFSLIVGLLATAVTVYFILAEAEKIAEETRTPVDMRGYDTQIRHLREIVDEMSKTLPKETLDKIEDIKTKCPQCGRKVHKGYKLCPHCGLDWR